MGYLRVKDSGEGKMSFRKATNFSLKGPGFHNRQKYKEREDSPLGSWKIFCMAQVFNCGSILFGLSFSIKSSGTLVPIISLASNNVR